MNGGWNVSHAPPEPIGREDYPGAHRASRAAYLSGLALHGCLFRMPEPMLRNRALESCRSVRLYIYRQPIQPRLLWLFEGILR